MIGPIDGHGGWGSGNFIDRFPRLQGLLDGPVRPGTPTAPELPNLPDLGGNRPSTGVSAVNVHMQVSQMLQSIGGGAQQDQTLQMLITLMILLALLQEQQRSSMQTAGALLEMLGRGRNGSEQVMFTWSYTSISFDSTVSSGRAIQESTSPQSQPPGSGCDISV